MGGDEFAVLQRCIGYEEAPETLAARIITAIDGRPFAYDGQELHLGTSVGIAAAPADGVDPSELMRNADLALYAAKAEGRGTFRHYDASLDEQARQRRELEEGLRRAITQHQLEIHYQPLIDASSGRITSAEALVRWNHPTHGLIPPSEFIGLAEETGLILPLGEWVLRTACMEAATWPPGISVAVNLSPVQFCDKSLVTTIQAALAAAPLAAERLELEITEGVLLTDEKGTLDTLRQLRALGTRISMDDFGTGYSSLSYLRSFPFDKIKIDRSFMRDLKSKGDSLAIIKAVIGLGHSLGMSTTAEGIETEEQLAAVREQGCN
ncbi:MAG: bifunctional diguanylate cyclase/phosphodiesterase, partial [Oxalobacteraceae bacterium]